ncbi:MAG: extracellular solute-binding protein [Lachnospiraceae bacterium]|nr:extracellular solute-binding protein [Lachnospiraceae bacterium]
MKKELVRRLGAFSCALLAALPLVSCGDTDTVEQKEWIYVPEFVSIEDENVSYYGMQMAGSNIYYTSYTWDEASETGTNSFCKYSLTDRQVETIPLAWPEGSEDMNINSFSLGQDGSIYTVTYEYMEKEDGSLDSQQIVYKFDAQGNMVYSEDLTKWLEEDEQNSYIRTMAADGQGRLYLCMESMILLFDAEGAQQGKISIDTANGWVNGMGRGKDGKMYINMYNYNTGEGISQNILIELDFEGRTTGNVYENFPNVNGEKITPGVEKDFLIYDNTTVYEYDLATQTKEEVFEWLDSDIDGNTVSVCGALEDGRFVVVYEDWQNDDRGVALLTKTKSSQLAQKETIVIGTLYGGSDLQSMAVKFNKSNDKYRISIRDYMPDGEDYEARLRTGITNMNNDVTSRNCPDILDLSGVNVAQLSAKGLFEDMTPYLEKSSVLSREDFVENVLTAYTYQDVLVSIPKNFSIHTMVGSKDDFEGKDGWTLEEMVAYGEAHPEAELFDDMPKAQMMNYMMVFNEGAFIDWSTGECKFDSDEFKNLLNFVNRFPDEVDYAAGGASTPTRIQNGEVLLDMTAISNFEDVQVPIEEFQGNAAFIGFPLADGQSGHALIADQACAILAKSNHKDGAWAFIESWLTEEEGKYSWGFPVLKSQLDEKIAEATKVEYYENENGEMVAWEGGSSVEYEDGWSYTYHTTTQEEVDMVMALIDAARPVSYNFGSEVVKIITEEAEAFYKGQKSVDEVAKVIQSRVKMYVGENS